MEKENLKLPTEILEPYILANSLKDRSFFLKIKDYLNTTGTSKNYFSDEKYQSVFNIICSWYNKFNKFPTKKEMEIVLKRKNAKNEELFILENSIVKKVFDEVKIEEVNKDFLKEEVESFIKENRMYEAYVLSQIDFENQNYSAVSKRFEEAAKVNFDKDLGVSIKDVGKAIELLDDLNTSNSISTGFSRLDAVLDGGVRGSELYCLSSPPGIGKTAILGAIAVNAFLQGKKALVITLETSTKRLLSRYYSNLLQKTKSEMISNLDEVGKNISDNISNAEGDIIIKQFEANQAGYNEIVSYITDLRMYKNWKPDIIFIDYIGIATPSDKSISQSEMYAYYKRVAEDFRNIALIDDIPVFTAAQQNRDSQDEKGGTKQITTGAGVANSRGIYDSCDVFITINQTVKEKENNIIVLYIDKNRNGETNVKIKYSIDYPHMTLREV